MAGVPLAEPLVGLSIRLIAEKMPDTQFTYTVKLIDNHKLITAGILILSVLVTSGKNENDSVCSHPIVMP